MKSFTPQRIRELKIPNRLVKVIRLIGEYKGKQDLYKIQAPEMLENLRQVAIIQSVESSNRIEGVVVADHKRLKDLVQEKTTPKDRSEGEIAGYRDVLNTIHANHEHIPFTEKIVLQLHRDLMKYSDTEGGKWKLTNNEIEEVRPDGTRFIRFKPVEPHLTEVYMQELHKVYNIVASGKHLFGDYNSMAPDQAIDDLLDPLVLTALYVLDFLCIHPFLDGNGRMARLLTVLSLYQPGYEVARYISLERIIETTKESYYETLYASSQGWHEAQHDPLPWIDYFLSIILAAYKEFEERAGTVSNGHGSKTEMVMSAINSFLGDFSISEVEEACPTVSRDWIRTLLQQLKKDGKVEVLGKGRYARWRKV